MKPYRTPIRRSSFTSDLDEAKGVFQKVGGQSKELDLDPIAEVVEKLKENKDGLNEVLDNLRERCNHVHQPSEAH